MTNVYQFFGIPNFSDMSTVKKAYRRMALENHPDRGGDAEKMKIINEVYETILSRKDAYDEQLRETLSPRVSVTIVFGFGNGSGWTYAN